ncbi:hypothetical protein D623_10035375 [Myotis brandtii]|uniref:Uncharacterized protein n=1 Tax=Myotis brandtii TaxID=109478 RepID=S7MMS9_MYOBR|nr:hypothetical protein D623_10035375 [Myotis brandtii]
MGQFLGFLKQQAESCGLSTRKVQKSSNTATPKPQTHLGQDDTPLSGVSKRHFNLRTPLHFKAKKLINSDQADEDKNILKYGSSIDGPKP